MKETVKINIIDENDMDREATILLYFRLTEFGKDYAVYTFGEKDTNQLEIVHTSIVTEENDKLIFTDIENDDEWKKVQEVMKSVIRSNRRG
ncbi:MAG: DUF1292 domain-containing protein [Bacilli bacterium]|jgi:uncharacterized protein YrzB (UPF0473 family)|nr:DUF1292 domain-containing protein [Bacilli bacterium]